MQTINWLRCSLVVLIALLPSGLVRADEIVSLPLAPEQNFPPITITDNTYRLIDWKISGEIKGSGTFTVSQMSTGGNPGAFRFMSYGLPPVPANDLYVVTVNHIFRNNIYAPAIDGEILALDYSEDGIILSFPYPDTASTTQPLLEQNGRLFRATKFIRFVAQGTSHAWENMALEQLTANDFVATDGSDDHPNFSTSGTSIRFGFTRLVSRGSTLPPVPSDQEMVIDQGVDNWQVVIHRDNTPRAPQAEDDIFILDGSDGPRGHFLDVLDNDTGQDYLHIDAVTQPIHASVINSGLFLYFTPDEDGYAVSFQYIVTNGTLTDTADVDVYIDCACTIDCLSKSVRSGLIPAQDKIDLPLIYLVRDQVLRPTHDGRRYVDMYYHSNPEILVNILANESLRAEAVATVELWQDPLHSLVEGDGSVLITQTEIDALADFLMHLSVASSSELQTLIANELARLGPLDDYVGMTVKDAKQRAIGDATLYLPYVRTQP